MILHRRQLIKLAAAPLVLPAVPAVARTPASTEGPFYPTPAMRFADADNDLVRIEGAVRQAGGEVVMLSGRVTARDSQPAAGARVEIWQCDVNGVYLHTRDRRRGGYDTGFQGFGHVVTGSDGQYAFRTIKPVSYPGRTPHIHVKVFHGKRDLTTQIYIKGDPQNERDGLFRRLSAAERKLVEMEFRPGPQFAMAEVDFSL
jgi:protocatechuate 3,4-dioxygenase beta subunit